MKASSLNSDVNFMKHANCPIWNTSATGKQLNHGGDGMCVNSPRAGGLYEISGTAVATVQSLDDAYKVLLTTWIIDQHLLGNEMPAINSATVRLARQARPLTVFERRDRLIAITIWIIVRVVVLVNDIALGVNHADELTAIIPLHFRLNRLHCSAESGGLIRSR